MSLIPDISTLSTRIGTEFKTAYGKIGDLSSLATTVKSDLVSAINEVRSDIPVIDDAVSSGTKLWSSTKVAAAIQQMKDDLLGGAGSAWDTLMELATAIQSDESSIGTILTALGLRVRVDAAQAFTSPQKQQGRDNLDVYGRAEIGDITTDLVAVFEASLV